MLRILLALCLFASLAPLTACGDDDPEVITTGSGPGVTVVKDDD
jgi:hypothetical protein